MSVMAPAAAESDSRYWSIAAREPWVAGPPAASASGPATGVQLHDRQIRITADGDDRYEHSVLRVSGSRIIHGSTEIDVPLDPRSQELVIHGAQLTHGGAAPRAVTPDQIREQLQIQPREAEPRKRALDPQLRVSIRIAAVQAGDLLDYEYTVHSSTARTPGAPAGHYAAQWTSGGDEPVRSERLRVTWPAGRDLRFRLSGGAKGPAPRIVTGTGQLELLWQNLLPPPSEPDTPRWFQRTSAVQLSDFTDWPQVAASFSVQYSEPPLRPGASGTPGLILEALRQVQSRVQATNVAGDAPYVPADPATVLQRGYGDSRDLARLLVSLLHQDAIDAQVALTDSRGMLGDETLPSPFMLDSAIVVARAGGADYWLNPAAPGPAEALGAAGPADVRHALLVAASGGALVALPRPAADSRMREVIQQFDLRNGNARPATLNVVTRFRGGWARAVRAGLAGETPAQLQLTQIQGVAQDYPNATLDGEVAVSDVGQGEGVQLQARFRIPRPFGDGDEPGFGFFAEALADRVEPRDETTRRYPLDLSWPLQLEEHISALLPSGFTVPEGKVVVDTKAFRYERSVRLDHGALQIDHRYVAKSDHVNPADYPQFLQASAQVYQALGVRAQAQGFSSAGVLGWLAGHLFVLAGIAAAAVLVTAGLIRLRRS